MPPIAKHKSEVKEPLQSGFDLGIWGSGRTDPGFYLFGRCRGEIPLWVREFLRKMQRMERERRDGSNNDEVGEDVDWCSDLIWNSLLLKIRYPFLRCAVEGTEIHKTRNLGLVRYENKTRVSRTSLAHNGMRWTIDRDPSSIKENMIILAIWSDLIYLSIYLDR